MIKYVPYAFHFRLIVKPVVDFLLVILFSLGVTAEALQANIDYKSAFLIRRRQFGPKFQVQGVVLHQPLYFLVEVDPYSVIRIHIFV